MGIARDHRPGFFAVFLYGHFAAFCGVLKPRSGFYALSAVYVNPSHCDAMPDALPVLFETFLTNIDGSYRDGLQSGLMRFPRSQK